MTAIFIDGAPYTTSSLRSTLEQPSLLLGGDLRLLRLEAGNPLFLRAGLEAGGGEARAHRRDRVGVLAQLLVEPRHVRRVREVARLEPRRRLVRLQRALRAAFGFVGLTFVREQERPLRRVANEG